MLRKHVGCNAHENCVFCSCTPEIYKPPQQALSSHISRGYTAQQNSQPFTTILGGHAWTPPRHAAPRWRVQPEAEAVRAILTSRRARNVRDLARSRSLAVPFLSMVGTLPP